MRTSRPKRFLDLSVISVIALVWPLLAGAFEGRIAAELIRGTETNALLYTVGTNHLRIEVTGSTWPHPVNIVELNSGAVTLLFPHNRSFVRLKNLAAGVSPAGKDGILPPAFARELKTTGEKANSFPLGAAAGSLPGGTPAAAIPFVLSPGIGPQPGSAPGVPSLPNLPSPPVGLPPGIGPQPASAGAVPAMPAIPMPMMSMPGEKLELKPTTDTIDILGFRCVHYDAKQRGQTLEIWATDKLLPFQQHLRNQPTRFGPRMLEEQWPELLTARKLFPLRVSLRMDNGTEVFRFEAKSVTPEKITDPDGKLFQPPPDYHEMEPLPF